MPSTIIRKERLTQVREKVKKQKQIDKHRKKRYTKSTDEKAMDSLLSQALAIIYKNN